MSKGVNLVPEVVKKEQAKKSLIKKTTLVSVIIFVFVGLGAGYIFFRDWSIKDEISTTEARIEDLRSDIGDMSEIEVKARELDMRYTAVRYLFGSETQYSLLLREIENRSPNTINIESFTSGKENTINLSGKGSDYLAIAEFVNNLSDKQYPDSVEGLGGLFKSVSLNSVNLDTQSSKARFFIVVEVDRSLLNGGVSL